jgi:hypothetical protein
MLKNTISLPEEDGSKVASPYGEDGMGDFPCEVFHDHMTPSHHPAPPQTELSE